MNRGCVCFPKRGNDCSDPAILGFKVCRSTDMALDIGSTVCDACRQCMIDLCLLEAPDKPADFSTTTKVESTLKSWDDLNCRGDDCAAQCSYYLGI